MSYKTTALPAIDEIRQANSLFLNFLRSRPALARGHFGLSERVTGLLLSAGPGQIDRAADFPRALFRLSVPLELTAETAEAFHVAGDGARQVLQAALFQSAWNIARMSGYAARMLLRLDDRDVDRFRHAEMAEILRMSMADNVLHAAFDELDWIWQELLTETRPEGRERLLLIGLQPDLSLSTGTGTA